MDGDPFVVAHVEEVWIGRRHVVTLRPCCLGRNAVGKAHCPLAAVIVPRPQRAGASREGCVDRSAIQEAELGHVQSRDHRSGWRLAAQNVIDEIVADHRRS